MLDSDRVQVLIRSRELGERYGEPAVAVLFRHGRGEVFHMISHYYLQRTELRSARHAQPAAAFAAEQGVELGPEEMDSLRGFSLGEVESAASSSRLFANVLAAKKEAQLRRSPSARRRAQERERPPEPQEGEDMA